MASPYPSLMVASFIGAAIFVGAAKAYAPLFAAYAETCVHGHGTLNNGTVVARNLFAVSYNAAASDGRWGALRALPLALVLFRVGAAPMLQDGTECRWRFRLSLASAARARRLLEYSCRAWRRFRGVRQLPTSLWRSFISSTPGAARLELAERRCLTASAAVRVA